jgi:hypothetical protein
MTPKKIFVSGPLTMSGKATPYEVEINAWEAIQAGAELIRKGHYPFIPHLGIHVDRALKEWGVTIPWQQWMDLDEAYLEQCDALLTLGSSEGADIEYERALSLGMPIFVDVNSVPMVDEEPMLATMPRIPAPPSTEIIEPLDMLVLADMLKALRDRKKTLEDAAKTYASVIEMTEKILFEKMVEEEVQRFSRGGYTFYLNPRTYISAPPENAAAVNQWFKDHDMGDLVKETINPRTLSSQVNGMMGEGGTQEDLPEDLRTLLNFYEKAQVGIRRG